MTLANDSRYQEGEFLWVTTKERGNKQTVYLDTVMVLTAPYQVHYVREGDNVQILAALYFGDPHKWYVIADANPHVFNPWDLHPGDQLRIMR
jgi:hypothetical protein